MTGRDLEEDNNVNKPKIAQYRLKKGMHEATGRSQPEKNAEKRFNVLKRDGFRAAQGWAPRRD